MTTLLPSRFFRFASTTAFFIAGLATTVSAPVQASSVTNSQEELSRRGIPSETKNFAIRNSSEFPNYEALDSPRRKNMLTNQIKLMYLTSSDEIVRKPVSLMSLFRGIPSLCVPNWVWR